VTPPELADYITSKVASELADFHHDYITLLASQGKIKAFKFGREWMIYKPSLEAYLASNRKPGPKPKKKKRR